MGKSDYHLDDNELELIEEAHQYFSQNEWFLEDKAKDTNLMENLKKYFEGSLNSDKFEKWLSKKLPERTPEKLVETLQTYIAYKYENEDAFFNTKAHENECKSMAISLLKGLVIATYKTEDKIPQAYKEYFDKNPVEVKLNSENPITPPGRYN